MSSHQIWMFQPHSDMPVVEDRVFRRKLSPSKRNSPEMHTHREGHVTTKAESGVMCLQAKEGQELPAAIRN